MFVARLEEKRLVFLLVNIDQNNALSGLLMHPAVEGRDDSDKNWDVEASKTEMMQYAKDMHPAVRKLCELAEEVLLWTLDTRDAIKQCTNGRAVAIGDAAHPHVPHHGQGASSAIEDAASLAIFLRGLTPDSDIPTRLRQWQDFRLPRAGVVQTISQKSSFMDVEALKPIFDELGYTGSLPENVDSHSEAVQKWLFNYDVRKEAEKAVKGLGAV